MKQPMSPVEFRESARIFRHMHLDAMLDEKKFMDVEYRAYCAFIETADPKHVKEFFEKGSMRFGKWNLYADLSIGPAKTSVKHTRLSCTDGGAFDLPYFDKLIQKYLYLKNNPDTIIQIGLRHLTDGPRRGIYTGDTLNRVTIEWKEIMKRRSLRVHGDDVYKIVGLDGWRVEVMRWFYPNLSFAKYPGYTRVERRCAKARTGSITVGDNEALYVEGAVVFNDLEVDVPSYRRRRRGRTSDDLINLGPDDLINLGPMGEFFSSAGFADARRYPHFFTHRVKEMLESGGVAPTKSQMAMVERMMTEDMDAILDALRKDMRPFRDDIVMRIFICMVKNPRLKPYMRMQTQIVFAMLLAVLEKVSPYDVIDYYALHPEHVRSIEGGKKP